MTLFFARYVRRGQPARWTGWGIREIVKYMKWQVSNADALGLAHPADFGGFSWMLPEKERSGKPAPLPSYVVEGTVPETVLAMYQEEANRCLDRDPSKTEKPKPPKEGQTHDFNTGYIMRARLRGFLNIFEQVFLKKIKQALEISSKHLIHYLKYCKNLLT